MIQAPPEVASARPGHSRCGRGTGVGFEESRAHGWVGQELPRGGEHFGLVFYLTFLGHGFRVVSETTIEASVPLPFHHGSGVFVTQSRNKRVPASSLPPMERVIPCST